MGIEKLYHDHTSVFGFKVTGKLTTGEIESFVPELEKAIERSGKKLRLLVNVARMDKADIKAEWDIFEFLRKHIKDIELIAIVGAHSWTKVMSEILSESIFVEAETLYFKPEEVEDAWGWLAKAAHPSHIPVRRVVYSDKGLFTKYGSPDYI